MNLNSMFGKIAPGMCRLSMNGGIAIKTSNGYKVYNLEKNTMTNCDNFVFDIGQDFFFLIPTNKVVPGDIILAGGKPKCVISTDKTTINVINYEDSTLETILPERHIIMGNTYMYGKIVSMFGTDLKGKGMNSMMKYMMMSEMFKGKDTNSMLPMMFMMNGDNNFFNFFEDESEDK